MGTNKRPSQINSDLTERLPGKYQMAPNGVVMQTAAQTTSIYRAQALQQVITY